MTTSAIIFLAIMVIGLYFGWWGKLGVLSNVLFPSNNWVEVPIRHRLHIAIKKIKK